MTEDPTDVVEAGNSESERPVSPGVQKARRLHRWSIGALCVVVLFFLLGTVALDLDIVIDRLLYAALTVAAVFVMITTMNVMIHKSE